MNKKIVISPTNTRAIAFFEELNRKKADIKKRLEIHSLDKVKRDADKRTGK